MEAAVSGPTREGRRRLGKDAGQEDAKRTSSSVCPSPLPFLDEVVHFLVVEL